METNIGSLVLLGLIGFSLTGCSIWKLINFYCLASYKPARAMFHSEELLEWSTSARIGEIKYYCPFIKYTYRVDGKIYKGLNQKGFQRLYKTNSKIDALAKLERIKNSGILYNAKKPHLSKPSPIISKFTRNHHLSICLGGLSLVIVFLVILTI